MDHAAEEPTPGRSQRGFVSSRIAQRRRPGVKEKAPSGLASTKAFRGFNQQPVHTRLLDRAA